MKSFRNKKALTLAELLVSVVISASLFWIVIFFTMTNVNEIADNQVKKDIISETIIFEDTIRDYILKWFNKFEIINQEDTQNKNSVLLITNYDNTEWLILWVVNLETKLIQKDYVYWNNFIWYRMLSESEITEILSNKSLVFDKEFQLDKIFQKLRIKDFNLEAYNDTEIINLNYSIVRILDESLNWTNFNELIINDLILWNYDLVL